MKALSITTIALFAATPSLAQTPVDPPAFAPELPGLGEPAETAGAGEGRIQRTAGAKREPTAEAAPISGMAVPRNKNGAFAIRKTDQIIAGEAASSKQVLELASWPRFPRTHLPGREDGEPLAER
jgi:hypothetical protein